MAASAGPAWGELLYSWFTMPFSRCCRSQFSVIEDFTPGPSQPWDRRIILGQIPMHTTCGDLCEPDDLGRILETFRIEDCSIGLVVRGTNDFEHESGCCFMPAQAEHWHEAVYRDALVSRDPDDVAAFSGDALPAEPPSGLSSAKVPLMSGASGESKAEEARPAVRVVAFPLPDAGDGKALITRYAELAVILDAMNTAITNGQGIYVHCKAGVGRSWMILMCYLATYGGLSVEQAQALTTASRPAVEPTSARIENIKKFVEHWNLERSSASAPAAGPA